MAKAKVWRLRNGTRCIELPDGQVYRVTQTELAEVVAETLSEPDPPEMRVELLRRLCTPQEWAQAVKMAEDLRGAGAIPQ